MLAFSPNRPQRAQYLEKHVWQQKGLSSVLPRSSPPKYTSRAAPRYSALTVAADSPSSFISRRSAYCVSRSTTTTTVLLSVGQRPNVGCWAAGQRRIGAETDRVPPARGRERRLPGTRAHDVARVRPLRLRWTPPASSAPKIGQNGRRPTLLASRGEPGGYQSTSHRTWRRQVYFHGCHV